MARIVGIFLGVFKIRLYSFIKLVGDIHMIKDTISPSIVIHLRVTALNMHLISPSVGDDVQNDLIHILLFNILALVQPREEGQAVYQFYKL